MIASVEYIPPTLCLYVVAIAQHAPIRLARHCGLLSFYAMPDYDTGHGSCNL